MTTAGVEARPSVAAARADRAVVSDEEFHEWWQALDRDFEVAPIPFSEMTGWRFLPESGNLAHESGRFYSVEGMEVREGDGVVLSQPIINQPEIGILGILVKEFDGVLHCLMQAKFEPGNVNIRQLSPTVQATRSNFTRVHQGGSTPYVEYFNGSERGRVLVDVLQSEQGSWFWRKRNRNIVVQVSEDVPLREDFCWLTLNQLQRLLRVDNLVNMDARTVLACLPVVPGPSRARPSGDPFTQALLRSYAADGEAGRGESALNTPVQIASTLIETKMWSDRRSELVPLGRIRGWSRSDGEIRDDTGTDFRIMGVRVQADIREVKRWAQPLLATRAPGLAVLLARPIDGVLHFLMQALSEPGLLDQVELAPTVRLHGYASGGEPAPGVPFLEEALTEDADRVRHDVLLSEEGGRFYAVQNRYRIVEVGPDFPVQVPAGFCWVTARQLMELLRHGHYLTIEARTLLACVHSLSAD